MGHVRPTSPERKRAVPSGKSSQDDFRRRDWGTQFFLKRSAGQHAPPPLIRRSPKTLLNRPMNPGPLKAPPTQVQNRLAGGADTFSPVACDGRSPHPNRHQFFKKRSLTDSPPPPPGFAPESTCGEKKKMRNEPINLARRYRKRGSPARTNPNRTHSRTDSPTNEPTGQLGLDPKSAPFNCSTRKPYEERPASAAVGDRQSAGVLIDDQPFERKSHAPNHSGRKERSNIRNRSRAGQRSRRAAARLDAGSTSCLPVPVLSYSIAASPQSGRQDLNLRPQRPERPVNPRQKAPKPLVL